MDYVPQEVAMLIEEIVSTSEEVGRDIQALEALQSDLHHMIRLHQEAANEEDDLDDVEEDNGDGDEDDVENEDDDENEDDEDDEEEGVDEEGREDGLSESEALPDMIVDLPVQSEQRDHTLSIRRMEV
eukprot:TRINITY_DN2573_c1_g1_i1.p1 TRINITY_DN2573_c1_g1~~TRINITY_DN2573_c1_g1_i1.p1  ORF type:complete len:128 (+),score=59.90 TRINITY_DN2573_c1_g1_i1:139-522(+)